MAQTASSVIPAHVADGAAKSRDARLSNFATIRAGGAPEAGKCRWDLVLFAQLSAAERAAVAWIIADQIMSTRGGRSRAHEVWRDACLSGASLDAAGRRLVEPFIRPVFGTPTKPAAADDQLQGMVGEWLWYLLTIERPEAHRRIEHVEPPSWSVTEPGGDGLVVYRATSGDLLSFRLWELKKHTGRAAISATVGRAYVQLGRRAEEYLAKVTSASRLRSDDVGDLLALLVDLWNDADARAGVGVGVAAQGATPPGRCFTTMGKRFPALTAPGQLEGMLCVVEDLADLAKDVRRLAWTAL